jgi:integrase
MQVRFRYIYEHTDRHGNRRVYVRKGARKVRIREAPGTVEFALRYDEILREIDKAPRLAASVEDHDPNTFGWLVRLYEMSLEFRALDVSTQTTRRRLNGHMMREPVHPGADQTFRDFPLSRLKTPALEVLRDRKAGKPGAANDRVKALRALFKWAKEKRHVERNPALDLAKLRVVTDGWHTWTMEEVEQYERRHPVGTVANLALRLMLYTGARRSDAVRLGRPHIRDGELRWTAYKNRNRHPVHMVVPLLAPLAEAIEATPTGDLVFLTTSAGRPFSIAGFGNRMREWCDEAGLQHCSAHGLRKAGSTMAAENGATAHQLMAMYGWRSLAEAERYTRAAQRRRLAADGMGLLLKGMDQKQK